MTDGTDFAELQIYHPENTRSTLLERTLTSVTNDTQAASRRRKWTVESILLR